MDEESGQPLLRDASTDSIRHSGRSHGSGAWLQRVVSSKLEDFNVDAKNADPDSLEKWRKASLVLNASRRFRYTANVHRRVSNLSSLQQFRVSGLAIEAIRRFQAALPAERSLSFKRAKEEGFGISSRYLETMVDKSDMLALQDYGGAEGLASLLHSSINDGIILSESEISRRQKAYGSNTIPEKVPKSFLSFVWDASQDVTLIILAVCAVVSILVGIPTEGLSEGWYDGVGIATSIIVVVLVTATSDYQQSLQFKDLDDEKKKVFVEAIRSGNRQKVLTFDVVVGDVVILSIGDIIPADGIFISGHSLLVDESSMTGESEPLNKDEDHPFLQAGCKVVDGSAKFLVTGVGMNTQWGNLLASLDDSGDEETPLQVRLSGVATLIGNLGLAVACLVFVVLLVRFFIDTQLSFPPGWIVTVVNFFAVSVTIIVVAVPEGLPLAVTLTLAFAMKKMMADKALVRKLAACETMGSATTICSDKTGTLTTNQMTVVQAWLGGLVRNVHSSRTHNLADQLLSAVIENIYMNTSGDVGDDGALFGSPTETAILRLAEELGGNFKEVRSSCQVIAMEPFNSKRKRMGVLIRRPNGKYRVHWKGAAEIVLGLCDKMAGGHGEVFKMEEGTLVSVIECFAEAGLRTLSLAYRDLDPSEVPNGPWPNGYPLPSNNLTLLSIVGIKDPLREGVPASVKLCQSAGIKVRMVTGDNLSTAKAIASECGIFNGGIAIEGPVFRELSPAQRREIIPKLEVMARSSPSDKLILVKELRAMGDVVAVTGDGTNDAPALKESDIGLAMGIAGTEVAKESADIIVLDDNFSTIVQVAKWGRSVYSNIQKFVQFQLTVNIVALVINFVSACITGSAPLTAVQLLWVNLIMDTLGALALATEPPDDALMLKPPVGRGGQFVSNIMWRNIAGQAVYQLAVLGTLEWKGLQLFDLSGPDAIPTLNTLIFNAFVFCQVFNEFNSRHMEKIDVLSNLLGNRMFMGIIAVTVVFQYFLVEFLGAFASTVPLSWNFWLISVGIGLASMPIAALVKLIPVSQGAVANGVNDDYHSLPSGDES